MRIHRSHQLLLSVFVLELVPKLAVYRWCFHRDPWNLFDLVVIGIALVPTDARALPTSAAGS